MAFKPENSDDEITYMKYLDPSEFNIFVQSKFQDWQSHAIGYLQKYLTDDKYKPRGQYQQKANNVFLFARSSAESEHLFYEREYDKISSNSLSSLVLPPMRNGYTDYTYMRLSTYSLILVNSKNGLNLTTLYFNNKDFEKLLIL